MTSFHLALAANLRTKTIVFLTIAPAAPRASAFSRARKSALSAFLNGRAEKSSANTADQFALKSR